MSIIRKIAKSMDAVFGWCRAVQLEPVSVRWQLSLAGRTAKVFYGTVVGLAVMGATGPFAVWSAELPSSIPTKPGKTVAAGFGFQNAETSTITVKTYNADSGKVLSEDTYELDINEDGASAAVQPRERIFAGGVGLNAEGLSEFTLRVYDAANGRFLWEGRLNLTRGLSSDVAAYPVFAQVQPRAIVKRVSRHAPINGQPYFVLRAVNPQTGQLVWGDQFVAGAARDVCAERISRSVVGMVGTLPQDIDFQIKMPDESGRQLLWEDRIASSADEEIASLKELHEAPSLLPAWSQVPSVATDKEAI